MRNIICLLLLLVCAPVMNVSAQTSCEENSGILDSLLANAGPDDYVIVIGRLGARESSQDLTRKRLANVKIYLTEYFEHTVFSKNPERLILASGEKSSGLASIELFFRGVRYFTLEIAHNQMLYVGECALDLEVHKSLCEVPRQKIFFPCRKK